MTPVSEPVIFTKTINKSQVVYKLLLTAFDDMLSVNKKGVIIILDNGKRISKPTIKIACEANDITSSGSSAYKYKAWITLSAAEVEMLKVRKITDYRLYIFDGGQEPETQREVLACFNCLIGSR